MADEILIPSGQTAETDSGRLAGCSSRNNEHTGPLTQAGSHSRTDSLYRTVFAFAHSAFHSGSSARTSAAVCRQGENGRGGGATKRRQCRILSPRRPEFRACRSHTVAVCAADLCVRPFPVLCGQRVFCGAIGQAAAGGSVTVIRADHLTKRFSTSENRDVVAVDSVSFEVQSGEVFGLLGPNGAGKTTTLRMMLGLLRPSSGDARINGCSVSADPDQVKRLVGFVSTSVGVYQWLTTEEMLLFVGDLYNVPPETCRERIDHLSRLLDFSSFLHRRCGVLSTGQKQRVSLARALIHDPPVMLLDEPTRGLDIVGSQVIFEYLQLLKSEGRAVVICTHRLDEAERFGDRFGLMHQGAMRLTGTLAELQQQTGKKGLTDIFIDLIRSPQETGS